MCSLIVFFTSLTLSWKDIVSPAISFPLRESKYNSKASWQCSTDNTLLAYSTISLFVGTRLFSSSMKHAAYFAILLIFSFKFRLTLLYPCSRS